METEDLLTQRRTLLGAGASLFYDRPLHLVRGEGVWVWDADGNRYLDAYNNVPHVGHSHPRVAQAVASQARTLNSNTRYLDSVILDYADRLVATLPEPLETVLFACSGSEANDVALRMARVATGNRGVIVTDHAYHGTTDLVTQVTTSDPTLGPRAPWVATMPVDGDDVAPVTGALQSLEDHGVSALLLCTMLSSQGIVEPPPGIIADAVQEVRRADGVFIADEVQGGFGRTGNHMWAFERFEVVPDIVTMGKPMGNGLPISAVVTTSEIMNEFRKHVDYFNTFGGSQVPVAAAAAVLDVLEDEALQANALTTGHRLEDGFRELAQGHGVIGRICGHGLFRGFELITPRGTPATGLATSVAEAMRRHGVLIGATGPNRSVVKIRPPMPFGEDEAAVLLERLDQALAEVAR